MPPAPVFARDGFLRFPGFLTGTAAARLRLLADHVLAQWRMEQGSLARNGAHPYQDPTNLSHLTDPRWFASQPAWLDELLETIASPAIVDAVEWAAGAPVGFHNTQYFMNPLFRSWMGAWHRDSQFLARDTADEDAFRAETTGLHFRVALVDDDHLEYVPGSEGRADTASEARARASGADLALPGARRIALAAGDACLFHAWGVHRGRYERERERRTFDIIYGTSRCVRCPPDSMPPPPPLERLSARASAFFTRS